MHRIKRYMSPNMLNRVLRLRKNINRAHRRRAKSVLIGKHGIFSEKMLFNHLRGMGINKGDTLMVHCAYDNLLTYAGSIAGLINVLRMLVGPKGTLLMPALSKNMFSNPVRIFDLRTEPTYTGIIPELFRRSNGVIRSLHPRHSVCGSGPLAAEILCGHESCVYADGPDSPWDRLRKIGAKGINLGLKPGQSLTFHHWIEDIEPEKYPLAVHEGPFLCRLVNSDGKELSLPFYRRSSKLKARELWFGRKLSNKSAVYLPLKGTPLTLYDYKELAKDLVSLRDRNTLLCRDKFFLNVGIV